MSGDQKPKLYRIAEVRCVDAHSTLDDMRKRLRDWNSGSTIGASLTLAVFGAIDLVSIDEVQDLKQLSVAPTYTPVRCQRQTGAISIEPPIRANPQKPYVAVSYLKINPLADYLVGQHLSDALISEIRRRHQEQSVDSQILIGLDGAPIVVIQTIANLQAFEDAAWQMRGIMLKDLKELKGKISESDATHTLSRDEVQLVRALSWSHSVVGMPVEYLKVASVDQAGRIKLVAPPTDFKGGDNQDVILRTRHRQLPGSSNMPSSAASVLGHHDCVTTQDGTPTNEDIRQSLGRIWNASPASLMETEIEFPPRRSDRNEDASPDVATERFRNRLSQSQIAINTEFLRVVRPKKWRSVPSVYPYSPQRTNGGVNLLLAINQRFSDPFGLGHAWRLHEPLHVWLEQVGRRAPQDKDLRRWAKALERAIRLDDEQDDPSDRPSLSLSFASRGGYVALREAFLAYVEEVARLRSGMKCPLVVDSVDIRLKTRLALGWNMIVSVSGVQIQAYPLWPYMIHEIEHILIHDTLSTDSFFPPDSPPPNLLEARCDYAMIYTGALGQGEPHELLENAARVIAWSLSGDLHETTPRRRNSRPVEELLIIHLSVRLAYLAAFMTSPDVESVCTVALQIMTDGEAEFHGWWKGWVDQLHRVTGVYLAKKDIVDASQDVLRKEQSTANDATMHLPLRYYDKEGENRELLSIVGGISRSIPEWNDTRGGLTLRADQLYDFMKAIREPVWMTRRKHIHMWYQRPTK